MVPIKSMPSAFSRAFTSRLLVPGLLTLGTVALLSTHWPWPEFWHQAAYDYAFPGFLDRPGQQTLEQSISFYQGRVQKHPTDGLDQATLANLYIEMARTTRNDSWYLLAEKSAQQSLANLPFDNQGAVLALAQIAEAQHDFATAIRLAKSVGTPDALGLVVTAKLALGQVEDAAAVASQLAEQYPSLGSLTLKALAHEAQGQDVQALANFQRAIAAEEPESPAGSAQTRVFLGRFYAQRGDSRMAEALYREALRIVPDHPLAHLQLAELATVKGQYRRAKHHYHEVGGPTALHGLARLEALRGRSAAEAWQVAETELRRNVENNALGHRRDLAHLLLERGDPDDVAEAVALMATEADNRRDARTLDLLVWALQSAGRLPEAQQVMQEALAQGGRNAAIAYRAGEIELALNRRAQAEDFFRLATAIDPTFTAQTRQRLGLTQQEEKL